MKITDLIEQLERIKEKHGDIEVTMTGTFLSDGYSQAGKGVIEDVFESTVETALIHEPNEGKIGIKRVRLYWQC